MESRAVLETAVSLKPEGLKHVSDRVPKSLAKHRERDVLKHFRNRAEVSICLLAGLRYCFCLECRSTPLRCRLVHGSPSLDICPFMAPRRKRLAGIRVSLYSAMLLKDAPGRAKPIRTDIYVEHAHVPFGCLYDRPPVLRLP